MMLCVESMVNRREKPRTIRPNRTVQVWGSPAGQRLSTESCMHLYRWALMSCPLRLPKRSVHTAEEERSQRPSRSGQRQPWVWCVSGSYVSLHQSRCCIWGQLASPLPRPTWFSHHSKRVYRHSTHFMAEVARGLESSRNFETAFRLGWDFNSVARTESFESPMT